MSSKFVYVTFIRTTPQKLWDAITKPEFTRDYWHGTSLDSDWKVGSHWKMMNPERGMTDSGEVLEADPPRRLVLTWRHEFRPELKAEGFARATLELEPMDDTVKLTVTHESEVKDAKLIHAVSGGWPIILSSLKSLLETGRSFDHSKVWGPRA